MRLPGGHSLRPGYKACPICQGWGVLYQDVWRLDTSADADDSQAAHRLTSAAWAPPSPVEHPCGECEGRAQVPISRQYFENDPRPSEILRRHLAIYPFFKGEPTGLRYCDLCGDYADRDDLRRDGMTIHASRVCSLFDMFSLASQAAPGSVVSSGRFLNNYLPCAIQQPPSAPLNGCAGWVGLTVVLGRWARAEDGVYRLVFDGPVLSRDLPGAERLPKADSTILRAEGFGLPDVPEDWVRLSDKPIAGINSLPTTARHAQVPAGR